MSSILIKGVQVAGKGEGKEKDLYIEGNLIEEIADAGKGRISEAEFATGSR